MGPLLRHANILTDQPARERPAGSAPGPEFDSECDGRDRFGSLLQSHIASRMAGSSDTGQGVPEGRVCKVAARARSSYLPGRI